MTAKSLLPIFFVALLLPGCASELDAPLRPVARPVARLAAPPPPPRPPLPDNTPELYDCVGPDACPGFEQRARRRAAGAFACAEDQITAIPRPTRGLGVHASAMVFGREGRVEVHIRPDPGDAFVVQGCGKTGIIACVHANRSLHTASQTYENTDDRLCLWADE